MPSVRLRRLVPAFLVTGVCALAFAAPAGGLSGFFDSYSSPIYGSGYLLGGPDATDLSSLHVHVFAEGTDRGLYYEQFNGSGFSGWTPMGGVLTSDPGSIVAGFTGADDEVFVRGQDNGVWVNDFHLAPGYDWSGTWGGWYSIGGVATGGPDGDGWPTNGGAGMQRDVFVRGQDMGLWHAWNNGSTGADSHWSGWYSLGGVLTSDPGSVSRTFGSVDVFARGQDDGLWHQWWDGSRWSGWYPLGGTLASGPDAASCGPGHLDVFALGPDNAYWHIGWNGSSWTPWTSIGGQWTSDPGATCRTQGVVDVFGRTPDNGIAAVEVSST